MSEGLLTPLFKKYVPSLVTTTTTYDSDTPEWAKTGLIPQLLYTVFGDYWSPQTVLENIESGKAGEITTGLVNSMFPIKDVITLTGEGIGGGLKGVSEGATGLIPIALIIIAGLYLIKK